MRHHHLLLLTRAGAWLLVTLAPSLALAQEVSVASQETTIPGGSILLVAYLALWLLVLGFVGRIALSQQRASRELEALEHRLDELVEQVSTREHGS